MAGYCGRPCCRTYLSGAVHHLNYGVLEIDFRVMIEEHEGTTLVSNGGYPLGDCPASWDEARKLEKGWRKKNPNSFMYWSFDCGFKLDYDGTLMRVESRFYPPKTHYGPGWDGSVAIFFAGNEICKKKFECEAWDQLVDGVQKYVAGIVEKLEPKLKDLVAEITNEET